MSFSSAFAMHHGDPIDRLAPALRPQGSAFGSQRWRDLLFLHWPVDPQAIAAYLPAGLSVDTFQGVAYVGIVAFVMRDVRPSLRLPPLPGVDGFLQINVRTYVHQNGRDPGVWFFSLDAASLLAVVGARVWYRLPYFWASMAAHCEKDQIRYAMFRRGQDVQFKAVYSVGAARAGAAPGTRDHFLTERYRLYTRGRGDRLLVTAIHHTPYPLHEVAVDSVEQSLIQTAGFSDTEPRIDALFSPGVDVDVFAQRLAGA